MSDHYPPVCMVSTYPPQRCGIATYTHELACAMAAAGAPVTVLSERGAVDGTVNGVTGLSVWDRRCDWVNAVLDAVQGLRPSVVHVQYTPDTLGWDDRLPRLLDHLTERGVLAVVTLHTVHTLASGLVEGRLLPARFHCGLAARARALVVHGTAVQAEELRRQGVTTHKIRVIPHGTRVFAPPPAAESRARLGLPTDGYVLLCFGFIHVLKNVHTLVRAMARLAPRIPDARLLVGGSIQNRAWYNRSYLVLCQQMVRALGLSARVDWRNGFVPPDAMPTFYGAADLILLPYAQRYGSASGVVHNALGAGKVMVCSRSPKFAEIASRVSPDLQVATHSASAWSECIEHLLRNPAHREALRAKVQAYATETAWPRVAVQHLALYEELRSSGTRRTAAT